MNLIEARKLGHEGWVRSKSRTSGSWAKPFGSVWKIHGSEYCPDVRAEDLDAEDWEPKPEPEARNLYEFEIWFNIKTGKIHEYYHFGIYEQKTLDTANWRKIRVREVLE
jgi:hypothetical protein